MPPLSKDLPELTHDNQNGGGSAVSSKNASVVSVELNNSDDTDSDAASIQENSSSSRHSKANKDKELKKDTHSNDGIIFLAEENYPSIAKRITNCHIVVALSAAELAIRKEGTTVENKNSQLPARIRIVNKLLLGELSRLCGVKCNTDHVAPFRTLVLYEQELRQAHQQRESELEEISRNPPPHPAVLRTEPYVPVERIYAGLTHVPGDPKSYEDMERLRFLLDGLRVLMRIFDTELGDLIATVRRLKTAPLENHMPVPKLPFSYLWYLFNPGEKVVSLKPWPRVYRVLQATGGRKSLVSRKRRRSRIGTQTSSKLTVSYLTVDCFFLGFNGKEFGAMPNVFSICPYDDVISITDLPVFPLKFADQKLEGKLVERGHKFVELVEPRHRRYQGLSLKEGDRFDVYEEIDSDVIVDFQLAFQNGEAKISPPSFGGGVISNPTTEDEEEIGDYKTIHDDPDLIKLRWSQFSHATNLLQNQSPSDLSMDSYVLLPYRVYGYVLLSRKWLPLHIDLTKKVPEIRPRESDSFQRLVLPEGHKDIVRALVSAHARQHSTKRDIDLVKGKGKGLIILLHGAPGVGKTSTAECVAANAGRPLLPITCGDLGGISAKEVEQNLENFFDLARKWNCVLLLDEADVFLSTRDVGDIRQTSLVSVFLRVLEYYSGILILTTNRVGSFDEAIKSRVHCALYYPPLDKEQSLKIWKMNLKALEEHNEDPDPAMRIRFDRKEIEKYARQHWKSTGEGTRWNGRQIKNAFQTAIALADWDHVENTGGNLHPDGPLLKVEHFKKVAQASVHFDNYLIKVRNTDGYRAQQNDIRRDDIGVDLDKGLTERSSKAKSSKSKSKSPYRPKTRSPEPSDESSSGETESEEESDVSDCEGESEEEKEKPPSPSPSPKKKSSKKKRGGE